MRAKEPARRPGRPARAAGRPRARDEAGPADVPRKGAATRAAIPPEVLRALNAGTLETRTLVEWLAIDMAELARAALADALSPHAARRVADELDAGRSLGISARTDLAGRAIARELGTGESAERRLARVSAHPSDTVRGWAAIAAAERATTLARTLLAARPFARDAHFGVREIAWMAARPRIAAEIERALALLARWSQDRDAKVRRFASESTRPRGVWCKHIAALRADPAPGLVVLEPLRADTSKYVRDSVANWLNDAAKDHPDWVRSVCARWSRASPSEETAAIVKRALRSTEPGTTPPFSLRLDERR